MSSRHPVVVAEVTDEPWSSMEHTTRAALWNAGLTTVIAIERMTTHEIAKKADIAHREAREVRRLIPHVAIAKQKRRSVAIERVLTQEAARAAFAARIPKIEEIIDDPETTDAQKLRAMDILGRYGVGPPDTKSSIKPEDVRELVKALALATMPLLEDSEKQQELGREWFSIVRARFPSVEGE